MDEVGNTRGGNKQDSISIHSGIITGSKETFSISATYVKSTKN